MIDQIWSDIMNSGLADEEDNISYQEMMIVDEIIFGLLLEIYCYLDETDINEIEFIEYWDSKLTYEE